MSEPKTDEKKPLVKRWNIPICDAAFTLIVFPDFKSVDQRIIGRAVGVKDFHENWWEEVHRAFTHFSLSKGRFAITLILQKPQTVELEVVTHETFHLTCRISEWSGCNFSTDNHENAALLNGYLNALIFGFLQRNKIKVVVEGAK